jgi:hypothetical protein
MLLTAARTLLTTASIHASESQFSNTDKDYAIQSIGYELCEELAVDVGNQEVTLSANQNTVNIQSTLSDFEVNRFIRARIGNSLVELTTWDSILRMYADDTPIGIPNLIAFDSESALGMYAPQPKTGQTMVLTYRKSFVSFTAGTGSPGSVTLNIPEEIVRPVIFWGAKYFLLDGEQDNQQEAQKAYVKYREFIDKIRSKYPATTQGVKDRQAVA